jgi:hypothetical protein
MELRKLIKVQPPSASEAFTSTAFNGWGIPDAPQFLGCNFED